MSAKEQKNEWNGSTFSVVAGGNMAGGRAEYSGEDEIDLVEVAYVLFDKLRYIVFFGLLGALILNAYAFFMIKPTYESTATMYIVSASDDSVVDLTDLNIGTSLTSDYKELIYSYPVLEQVIEKLDLDMTYEGLSKLITLENPADTRILKVTATTTDPELSRDIANTLVGVSVDYLPETMGTEQPNIAQEARAALQKSDPSYMKYTLLGGILGAFLCCAYLLFKYFMDDTLHTAEDIEKYFGVTPLTVIPDMGALDGFGEDREKKKNTRSKKYGKNRA